jgi:hypothetical protein
MAQLSSHRPEPNIARLKDIPKHFKVTKPISFIHVLYSIFMLHPICLELMRASPMHCYSERFLILDMIVN